MAHSFSHVTVVTLHCLSHRTRKLVPRMEPVTLKGSYTMWYNTLYIVTSIGTAPVWYVHGGTDYGVSVAVFLINTLLTVDQI